MFEELPDEILMIILRYSGDIFTVFRAFLGLNERINRILLDRRTHVLADFLTVTHGDVNIDHYYNTGVFDEVTNQLSSLKSLDNPQELRPYLEKLVTFQLKQQYEQYTDELELGLVQHQSIRMAYPDDVLEQSDVKLKEIFMSLQTSTDPIKPIEQILLLISTTGARLECTDPTPHVFNFAEAVNTLLLEKITDHHPISQRSINSLVRMFKALLMSNLTLLHNCCHESNTGFVIYYFLLYTIYKCQRLDGQQASTMINVRYYRATVDLLLFTLQCLHYESVDGIWGITDFAVLLEYISSSTLDIHQEIFVYISQSEILKILFERNILNSPPFNDESPDALWKNLGHLFTCHRWDLLLTLLHSDDHIHHRFTNCWNHPNLMNFLIGTQEKRRLLQSFLDHSEAGIWLTVTTKFLFILLDKKEFKLIKRLFHQSPSLIDRLDDEENDPLLYICLKVRGCRERLIEYLLKQGCDTQRRNIHGENFITALHLEKNRNLFKKLIEHEIIDLP